MLELAWFLKSFFCSSKQQELSHSIILKLEGSNTLHMTLFNYNKEKTKCLNNAVIKVIYFVW